MPASRVVDDVALTVACATAVFVSRKVVVEPSGKEEMMTRWSDPKSRIFVSELGVTVPLALAKRFEPLIRAEAKVGECLLSATELEIQLRRRFLGGNRLPADIKEIADLTAEEVRAYLRGLSIRGSEPAVVFWPYEGYSLSMSFASAVQFYDDLWYPSSDDLWIAEHDLQKWMVIIDHEERIEFYR